MASGPHARSSKDDPLRAAAGEPADRELLERFVRWQDQAAFAALVERHGPMVLGVCRRVLRHTQEAEDAFQATFLILARKAGAIAQPELLANWLYGVATRTARKAHSGIVRRTQMERQAPMAADRLLDEADHSDLLDRLDQELDRLPYKYRAALVLCYLEGLTNEEAAHRLGWPTGSISYRLARGREMLRERLDPRGIAPPAFALLLRDGLGTWEVPPALSEQTVEAAMSLVHGQALTAIASPTVRHLVEEASSAAWSRTRRAALLLLLLALLGMLGVGTAAAAAYLLTPSVERPASCH
jgi:RNA polymerase sigma factor (sigma-70 family)